MENIITENTENQFSDNQTQADFDRRVEEIQRRWELEGDMIKGVDPDFDLARAFENPEFYDRIVNQHETVMGAYTATYAKMPRRNISEVGNFTNGVCPSANHDIETMSDREFDDYIRKIKNS